MAFEKRDIVDRLKMKLYARIGSPVFDIKKRTPLPQPKENVPVQWEGGNPPTTSGAEPEQKLLSQLPRSMAKKHRSFATKFFIGSVVFFLAALAVAAYLFFAGGNTISPQNIDMQVVMPSLVDSGKEASFDVIIGNRNPAPLQLVDLIIDYPSGTRDAQNNVLAHVRQSIGTIASGEQLKRTASAVFYGQEGTQQKITATLEYSVVGSNAIFQKTADVSFAIGSSPISITVNAPTEAISGQTFPIDVVVQSNLTTTLQGVAIQGQYPFGYTVESSTPLAEAGNTLWRLGTLAPGASRTLHLTGSVDGQDGDSKVFRFIAGTGIASTDTTIALPILVVPYTTIVRQPFITAILTVDSQTGKTVSAQPGEPVTGTITWKNNLPDSVSDVSIVLSLTGPIVDKSTVTSANGFYQSSDSTLTWSKDQEQNFAQIAPGETGTLSFSFSPLVPGASGVVYMNPTAELGLTIKGTRQSETNVPEQVSSAASTEVQFASAVSVDAKAVHFSGPFVNSGPMPPVAEQPTTYSVVWTVKNSSNAVANTTVSTVLPPYVNFVTTTAGNGISYDASSRTVTWNIGNFGAGVGYSSQAQSSSFQLSLSPSSSQIGNSVTLTGLTTLSGEDRFAQVQVQASANVLTTDLSSSDTNFLSGMEKVVGK